MNAKALIPLVAGLGIGGLALKLGIDTLKNARGAAPPAANTAEVWAAKADIPRGTVIEEEMISAMLFPTELIPEGAFRDKEELLGRVPRIDAPGGLPLLENMLREPGAPPGICIKPGYRAVAVRIDAGSGVDYHLEPGCRVDVMGSFKVRGERGTQTVARTVLENIDVIAVGPRISAVDSGEEDGRDRSRVVRAVVLMVRPDEQNALLLAEEKGRIKLSRRGDQDGAVTNDRAVVSEADLMRGVTGGHAEPEPEKGPSMMSQLASLWGAGLARANLASMEPPWAVQIIRGGKQQTVVFKSKDSTERVGENGASPLPAALLGAGGLPGMPVGASENGSASSSCTVADGFLKIIGSGPEESSE